MQYNTYFILSPGRPLITLVPYQVYFLLG